MVTQTHSVFAINRKYLGTNYFTIDAPVPHQTHAYLILEFLDVSFQISNLQFLPKHVMSLSLTLSLCAARLRLRRDRAGLVLAGPRPLTGLVGGAVGGAVPSLCSAPSWGPLPVMASGARPTGGGGSARSWG